MIFFALKYQNNKLVRVKVTNEISPEACCCVRNLVFEQNAK